jgi:DHA1 family bicyclomycin/chloramphenicol resistance-like MFS transporter
MRRFGAERLITRAVAVNTVAAGLLLLVTLLGIASLPVALPLLFVACWSLAFVGAPGTVLALDPHGARAGTASALIGTIQFGLGALASGLISTLFDGTPLPMVAVMAGCALLAALITWLLLGRRQIA